MKVLFFILSIASSSAFASVNDFECRFEGQENEKVKVKAVIDTFFEIL
mgnify:CR=1 FL=1